MQSPNRLTVILAFAAIYLIWGSTYLAILYAVESLPPFLMAGLRFLAAGAAMFLWARFRGVPAPSAANWRSAVVVGGLLLLGGNGGVVWAEQTIPSWLAAVMVSTVPLWLALLDRKEATPLGPVALGFLGIVLLVAPAALGSSDEIHLLGALVVLASAGSWALGSLYSRTAPLPASPILATGMQMLGGGALLTIVGLSLGEHVHLATVTPTPRSLWALAYLSVFGSIVAFTAYVWLMRHVPTRQVATYAYVNPVVALLLGWAFAGETLTVLNLVAVAVILAAVVLLMRGPAPLAAAPLRPMQWLRRLGTGPTSAGSPGSPRP